MKNITFKITVTRKGHFVFSTSPNSAVNAYRAKQLLELFEERFPDYEGYEVTVTKWESEGKPATDYIRNYNV